MALPTFAELAGDTEPRLIEASRLFRAVPAMRERGAEGAKQALIGATDAAAREAALRWLEGLVSRGLAMAELVEGPRADASNTDAWAQEAAHLVLGHDLPAYLDGSPMARDPDWPPVGKVAMALCDPTMRGEATRLLRDMWWRAMQTEQIEARKKPGAFLASVGITAAHVAKIEAEGEAPVTIEQVDGEDDGRAATFRGAALHTAPVTLARGDGAALDPVEQAEAEMEDEYRRAVRETRTAEEFEARMAPVRENYRHASPAWSVVLRALKDKRATLGEIVGPAAAEAMTRPHYEEGAEVTQEAWDAVKPAPREHPPMPPRRGPQPLLPGAARRRPVDAKEIADAIKALGAASVAAADGLHTSLGISHSTWNNWLAGRNVPRVDVHKARVLSAEIARVIAELERIDEVLRQVVQ